MVILNLKRLNKGKHQKVLASNFPKAKEATWFMIISSPTKNDVLAIKRIQFNRYATKKVVIALPNDFLEEKIEMHIMCDSYFGLD